MAITTITPTLQPTAAAGAPSSALVLQAGQVITAEVIQVLGSDQVQIAIGNQTIEATTQVPLQVGQTLQLQVSQTSNGIGLAIVNQPGTSSSQGGGGVNTASDPVITLSPSLAASLAANLTPDAVTATSSLSALETLAVSVAAQTAASQQTSLAPLFADLNVASTLPNLPTQVQQAVAQVLTRQIALDPNLTGEAIKQAFQSSGLLLEASLASGSAVVSNGVLDLKAALIGLRQALTSALSDLPATSTIAPASVAPTPPVTPQAGVPADGTTPSAVATTGLAATSESVNAPQQGTALAAALAQIGEPIAQAQAVPAAIVAELASPEVLPGAPSIVPSGIAAAASAAPAQNPVMGIVQAVLELAAGIQTVTPAATSPDAAARAAASSAALNLLQEVLQASPLALTNPLQFVSQNSQALALLPVVAGVRTLDDAEFARSNLPPPPVGGALPSAQPIAPATLSARTPLETALQHLLNDANGAIARQTLLQIASLPGQPDPLAARIDAAAPRWNFEIPFATPQGTAMAQFEISRDGGGRETTTAKATWRARFTLNIEPAGPVHALVSLNGDRTSVRMWAERPATSAQLRAGVPQLAQALSRAELKPGDIVVGDGAPTQAAAAPAGHFLDRAS